MVFEGVAKLIAGQVHKLVGRGEISLERPPGDGGLIGTDSEAWKVHRDFTTMMVGGIGALLLQMLHPGALAGVWDHSNFRQDMLGRLKRTAQFISATTYGSTATAEGLIARVRMVHDRVHGTLPDGTPYSANDPELLTWIHVAEMASFLKAYRRYREPAMSVARQDRYFAETAIIAERLGATDVPKSLREVEDYLARMQPVLRADHRSREVARALLNQRLPSMLAGPATLAIMDAGIDILPDWAARMHGLALCPPRVVVARASVVGIRSVVSGALGAARRAQQTAAAS